MLLKHVIIAWSCLHLDTPNGKMAKLCWSIKLYLIRNNRFWSLENLPWMKWQLIVYNKHAIDLVNTQALSLLVLPIPLGSLNRLIASDNEERSTTKTLDCLSSSFFNSFWQSLFDRTTTIMVVEPETWLSNQLVEEFQIEEKALRSLRHRVLHCRWLCFAPFKRTDYICDSFYFLGFVCRYV